MRGPLRVVAAAALVAVMAVALAACGGPSATGAPSAAPGGVVSPVAGRVIAIDAEGLTRVKTFTLRTADGAEIVFAVGPLENATQFPPGHLAEHMATSSEVRVFFRDEAGERTVYRLEDAAP